MSNPILPQLARLRDAYVLHLTRLELSDMDPIFKQVAVRRTRAGIAELETQIANCELVHDDIDAAKRYADCHEQ